jgi:hypothetical protein
MTVNRSLTSKLPRSASGAPQAPRVAGETEIALAARLFALDVLRRIDHGADRLESWWKVQMPRTRVGVAIVALILGASLLNVVEMRIAQSTIAQSTIAQSSATRPAAAQVVLATESAPADAGKVWSLTKMWQGSGAFETTAFTVTDHWRVDWVFNQTQALGQLQVYIYSADGKLLNIAANVQRSDTSTTFWAGPGTYLLKVSSSGGDWKLDVQDLR